MAIFRQFTYTNTGTEIEFMQGLIDLICGLDDGITCEDTDGNPTDAAAQYADLTSAKTAEFRFNLGNGIKFIFRRWTSNNNYTQSFLVNNQQMVYSGGNLGVETAANRAYFITYLKSENLIALWIGSYNVSSITQTNRAAMVLKTSNDRFATVVNNYTPTGGTFTGSNSSVTYSPLFQYAAQAGKIDYADHAPFISGGTKQFDSADIFSCSTVSQFASITLPNRGNFYAIGTNALVPIDDE